MDQERRKVIIKEIEHWQRSKLLPDQYCDFLLNLYLDAGEVREPLHLSGKAAKAIKTASWQSWFLTFGIFSLICFVVLHFNAFHPLLQIGVTLSGVLILLLIGQRYRLKNEALGLGLVGVAMLLMLGAGMYMLQLHGLEAWGWQVGWLGICSLFWVAFGITARIPVLHLSGWVASFLVYGLLLSRNAESPDWYEVQLYWLPASFVFAWCSWFFHRWSRPVAAVLFIAGTLIWLMPELYTAVFVDNRDWFQLQLIVKIVAEGLLLFLLRKKWIAWVA
ncbi:hypothetical protein FHS18_001069 [Paenibacillus phyllosphaerae]|uniref:DUF2157 domain-containing protein n=1 Tax=Paenibacillus phyllosphaerae TaxID=274593 RepID=A0A7W5FLI2_9BACL|nr:hypothetical protein [Paenibacillus phyllosphaerae]MBB3109017.1 hypothetical protein [Paenibacillus phyllosphaerae]